MLLTMKLIAPIAAGLSTAAALSFFRPDQAVIDPAVAEERFLIETSPGETRWIREDEKWSLRRVRVLSCQHSRLHCNESC